MDNDRIADISIVQLFFLAQFPQDFSGIFGFDP
jgi:hypothetical protein